MPTGLNPSCCTWLVGLFLGRQALTVRSVCVGPVWVPGVGRSSDQAVPPQKASSCCRKGAASHNGYSLTWKCVFFLSYLLEFTASLLSPLLWPPLPHFLPLAAPSWILKTYLCSFPLSPLTIRSLSLLLSPVPSLFISKRWMLTQQHCWFPTICIWAWRGQGQLPRQNSDILIWRSFSFWLFTSIVC